MPCLVWVARALRRRVGKVVLVPLPPAAGQAIDQAIGGGLGRPILLSSRGVRMDHYAATHRLRRLA